MVEVHRGVCGPHMSGLNLSRKIIGQGFYWITMETDCARMVKHCHNCQAHGNLNHLPPTELQGLAEPWPFSAWGIDLIGEIKPQASNGHRFIVVAVDYFSKWVEAESFRNVTAKQMAKFISRNIIFGMGCLRLGRSREAEYETIVIDHSQQTMSRCPRGDEY